ncbi:MAG: hypothetical protein JWR47_1989 [Phenylobacterium sp.]|jgi:hypothetical protein|uniref:hypothetical protein n=1 Tax=Phenylobacterium sp. TaxID=1871053 RepID=UPI002610CBE5|nr:hypothetical protein [Phenylobacterium sp.]MDB5426706.1 hypothetical protein [Phenylobacterium sp.]MDB5435732.1 hypothetical protein [Phenylobacterium sp.]MDB5497453.1 hypothetical protein [Phenylobacterium sp.]
MNPTIERLKLIFLGIFAVANVGILIWTVGWAMPEQKCLEGHKWWDGYQRVCAQPILTSDLTGRMITDPAARAAALKAIGRAPPPAPAPAKP